MGDWYVIVVKSLLDDHWSESFGGLSITHDDKGETILSGRIVDQAALHGVLIKFAIWGWD